MSSSTAELTLILKAQNLADIELGKLKTAIGGVATKASHRGNAIDVCENDAAAFAGCLNHSSHHACEVPPDNAVIEATPELVAMNFTIARPLTSVSASLG